MKRENLLIGVILFTLGLIGVTSLLTMDFPIPEEAKLLLSKQFSPTQIKLLLIVNPLIMLIISVITGSILYKSVKLKVPIITNFINRSSKTKITPVIKYGIIGGVISGVLLGLTSLLFQPYLPIEFIEVIKNIKPSIAVRFLYGGITEEILIRFGLMTFIVWLINIIFKRLSSKAYWTAIIISSIIFALGHFPIVYQSVQNPSNLLLTYILIGNTIGGIIFGWLYWKKGLESAFIAHIVTHIFLILGEQITF